jgi:hypothetical protein
MEVSNYILDAITHAVRAVDRRSDGLQSVATRHSAASTAALHKVAGEGGDLAPSRRPRTTGEVRRG